MGPNLTAIVRRPGESFRLAVSLHPDRDLIDPERAQAQHAAYRRTLAEIGVEIVELPTDERYPDSCFTQDPALVLDGNALIGRLGVESRAGETEALEEALHELVDRVERVEDPATLEGGDVLRIEDTILVGRSTRTNKEGIEALRRFAEPLGFRVRAVDVPRGVLHLSTAASYLGNGLVIGLTEVVGDEAFRGLDEVIAIDSPLPACNVLTIGRQVIASGDYGVHDELELRGYTVHRLDLAEFVRADAGPTCLTLLVDGRNGDSGDPVPGVGNKVG